RRARRTSSRSSSSPTTRSTVKQPNPSACCSTSSSTTPAPNSAGSRSRPCASSGQPRRSRASGCSPRSSTRTVTTANWSNSTPSELPHQPTSLAYEKEHTMTTTTASLSIESLLPGIRKRREEIESARQLPGDLVDDLAAAGIFRLGIPKAFGGEEADGPELLRVIETLATADGSTGWCAMLG